MSLLTFSDFFLEILLDCKWSSHASLAKRFVCCVLVVCLYPLSSSCWPMTLPNLLSLIQSSEQIDNKCNALDCCKHISNDWLAAWPQIEIIYSLIKRPPSYYGCRPQRQLLTIATGWYSDRRTGVYVYRWLKSNEPIVFIGSGSCHETHATVHNSATVVGLIISFTDWFGTRDSKPRPLPSARFEWDNSPGISFASCSPSNWG